MHAISAAGTGTGTGAAARVGAGTRGAAEWLAGAAAEVPDFGCAVIAKMRANLIQAEGARRPAPAARPGAAEKRESAPSAKAGRKEPEAAIASPAPVAAPGIPPRASAPAPVEAGRLAILPPAFAESAASGGFAARQPVPATENRLGAASPAQVSATIRKPSLERPASGDIAIGPADLRVDSAPPLEPAWPSAPAGPTTAAVQGGFDAGGSAAIPPAEPSPTGGMEMAAFEAGVFKPLDAGPAIPPAQAAGSAPGKESAGKLAQAVANPLAREQSAGTENEPPSAERTLAAALTTGRNLSSERVDDAPERSGNLAAVADSGQLSPAASLSPALLAAEPAKKSATAGEVAEKTVEALPNGGVSGLVSHGSNPVSGEAGGPTAVQAIGLRGDRAGEPPPVVAPGEGFRRIDAAGASPQVLRPASRIVEVGIDDPAHGWVAVRAESASGQIHASLSAASPEAQSALRAQLAGMADYLAERGIGVSSLAVGHGADENAGGLSQRAGGDAPGGQGREFAGNADAHSNGGHHRESPQSAAAARMDLSGGDRSSDGRSADELAAAHRWPASAVSRESGRGSGFPDPPHAINVLA